VLIRINSKDNDNTKHIYVQLWLYPNSSKAQQNEWKSHIYEIILH